MSTSAISNASVHSDLKTYFQQRNSDLHNLGQMLQSGNLEGAQQAFQAIQNLGKGSPFANGDAFKIGRREHDFEAVGQALKSGDLNAAKQAFEHLIGSFRRSHMEHAAAAAEVPNVAATPSSYNVDVTA
jgi:TolA-binding protein